MKKRYLFLFLISGLVFVNSCQKEHSLESGNGPSEGTLQDDGSGDCLPKTVNGAYAVGVALVGTVNYIEVEVDVTTVGNYTIYTDTVNGMHFRVSGVFATTGLNTVRLRGFGTPSGVGITNFVVNYGASACTIAVTTVASLAVFTLDGAPGGCTNATPAGTYSAGTILNASNTVTIHVTVTTAGAYNISTVVSNGMTFSGFGTLALGAQTIILTGAGTPTAPGNTNVPLTAGSSSCGFTIVVGGAVPAATYTIKCATAVPNGTYTQNTALIASNTVTITVDVATAGTYSITGTVNGMTFNSPVGASFAAAGAGQTVTLNGTGTPTVSGANTVPLTGGTAGCSFIINVNPAAGAAVFTVNCASATPNGTYTQNTALTASNTITLPVNVTATGTYNITTTLANGMTFISGAGTFAGTGAQNVTLTGSGTPTLSGPTTINVPAGPCSFIINVNPAGGAAVFTVNCAGATPNGTYTQNTALTASNTITLPVNVTTPGTYNITTTLANGMTFSSGAATFAATGAVNVTLTGTGTPTSSGPTPIPVPAGPCNINITVNPAAGGAVFTVDCFTAFLNGYLTKGVPIAAVNTITIDVNVTTPGTYTIATTPVNGISYTASGTFAVAGATTVTLNGTGTPVNSGSFTLNIPAGNPACGFDVFVDPNLGTWSFKVGATTYSGTFYDAGFDNTNPPVSIFFLLGDDAAGNLIEIYLGDLNGTFANNETYKCAPPVTGNAAAFYYDGVAGTTYYADPDDPDFAANTLNVIVTSHNVATRTITGTFSGNAILNGGPALANITQGVFTITYP